MDYILLQACKCLVNGSADASRNSSNFGWNSLLGFELLYSATATQMYKIKTS